MAAQPRNTQNNGPGNDLTHPENGQQIIEGNPVTQLQIRQLALERKVNPSSSSEPVQVFKTKRLLEGKPTHNTT